MRGGESTSLLVFADITNPYRSMAVMLAEVISVAFDKTFAIEHQPSEWSKNSSECCDWISNFVPYVLHVTSSSRRSR